MYLVTELKNRSIQYNGGDGRRYGEAVDFDEKRYSYVAGG